MCCIYVNQFQYLIISINLLAITWKEKKQYNDVKNIKTLTFCLPKVKKKRKKKSCLTHVSLCFTSVPPLAVLKHVFLIKLWYHPLKQSKLCKQEKTCFAV